MSRAGPYTEGVVQMNTNHVWVVLVIVAVLGGCGVQPKREFISVTMPKGETATIGACNRQVPDWLYLDSAFCLDFVAKGKISEEQLQAAATVEGACRVYIGTAHPSRLVVVFAQGMLFAGSTALGIGLGAKMAYTAAANRLNDYYEYGAIAGLASGAASGTINSGGRTYSFQNCGNELLAMFPAYGIRVIERNAF